MPFDLKGFVEEFLEHFGVRGVAFARRAESTALFLESATISLGGKLQLGEIGQLSPVLAKKYDLRDAVFLAELNLRSTACATESGQVVQAAAAISRHPPRCGDAGAGSDNA
jgi:phenylalanyl-tRNA synthetase beta subunit